MLWQHFTRGMESEGAHHGPLSLLLVLLSGSTSWCPDCSFTWPLLRIAVFIQLAILKNEITQQRIYHLVVLAAPDLSLIWWCQRTSLLPTYTRSDRFPRLRVLLHGYAPLYTQSFPGLWHHSVRFGPQGSNGVMGITLLLLLLWVVKFFVSDLGIFCLPSASTEHGGLTY